MSRLDYCKHELIDDCYDWKNDNCDECNIFKAYCEGARRARASIVRCKDCKHWHSNTEFCSIWSFHFQNVAQRTLRHDYCSRGERKDGDDE